MSNKISEERITQFLTGRDQMTGIINMECGYNDDEVSIIYRHPIAGKRMKKADFEPFVWAKVSGARKLYSDKKTGVQDQRLLKSKMSEYGIVAKGLNIYADDGFTTDRMKNGYRVLFEAKGKMSFNKFIQFFKQGGCDLWGEDKLFLAVSPVEQYMMKSGKRMFKGFEDYDELIRMEFDLETDGLDPKRHAINQIGIRTNKGYEKILTITGDTPEERDDNELIAIDEFFRIVNEIKPDVITGHNSENFDWDYVIVRCNVLGSDIKEISAPHFKQPIYKKKRKTVLKLGGETEYFNQTVIWGFNITDSKHAVRRAQAIDSNLKSASLKYVSEYINAKKPNRVYVPGNKIGDIWADVENDYAFNDATGEWYVIDGYNELKSEFSIVDGRYIVERYLFDDLYETDKVELNYNQANFLLTKVLPTTFTKACTMGTAGTWKLIMMAWSYENGLAVPDFAPAGKFTGGLSRLMRVGYVSRVVKLDYNSLYPSINITWRTKPDLDVTGVMLSLLGYILDKREEYKGLKGKAGKKYKALKKELEELENKLSEIEISERKNELSVLKSEEGANDKKQLPFKIFANSFFGSFGAPNLFPWGDLKCAEKTTCIGRQSLRLMVYWFKRIGYEPIVLDTDGVNFSLPPQEELDSRTYIGKGLNRNTVDGKVYVGVEADVAEFSDLFLRGKMGLGIDEYCDATINFSRKNYADLLDNGKIKYVGNSIKSKKMPGYIERFLGTGIVHLLNNNGKDFLDNYYDYIDKIYNYEIPLIEIASKGKIKKTINEYKDNCKGFNKNGAPNSRQAWYELCIKHGLEPEMGEVIYYINIGSKKGDGDVKREKIYKTDENGNFEYQDIIGKDGLPVLTKRGKIKKEKIVIGENVNLNCVLIPASLVESGANLSDLIGTEYENIEYNVPKYIEQFNNRIKPLLVCFNPDIRPTILTTSPDQKQFFTEKQSLLTSGYPNKPEDQDTYKQLMQMEDKEIKFWTGIDEIPPFVNDIEMDWDEVVSDYIKRQEELTKEYIKVEVDKYNNLINELTAEDVDEFTENGDIPKQFLEFLDLNSETMQFVSKKHNVQIGTIYDIIDKDFAKDDGEDGLIEKI